MWPHVFVTLFFFLDISLGDVQVYFTNGIGQMVADFADLPAAFGESIPTKGIAAFVVYARPFENACGKLDPPPRNVTNFTKNWAVLIKRSNCTFEEKVLAAQNATYDLAIIHNVDSEDLKRMNANHPEKIYIPSVFVGERTGHIIKEKYTYDKGFLIRISEDPAFDFNASMLIPFLAVITLCLSTMLGFLIVKWIKDRRRAGRRRLPNSSLRKIPTAKYRKGDPYETCAICLDDYIEGEKLRILPCSHAYHSKCIDPWLTRNRRTCPMCKRKVYAAGERVPSDTDSASEDDDHTHLLRSTSTRSPNPDTLGVLARILTERMNRMQDQDDTSTISTSPSSSVVSNRSRLGPHSNNVSINESRDERNPYAEERGESSRSTRGDIGRNPFESDSDEEERDGESRLLVGSYPPTRGFSATIRQFCTRVPYSSSPSTPQTPASVHSPPRQPPSDTSILTDESHYEDARDVIV